MRRPAAFPHSDVFPLMKARSVRERSPPAVTSIELAWPEPVVLPCMAAAPSSTTSRCTRTLIWLASTLPLVEAEIRAPSVIRRLPALIFTLAGDSPASCAGETVASFCPVTAPFRVISRSPPPRSRSMLALCPPDPGLAVPKIPVGNCPFWPSILNPPARKRIEPARPRVSVELCICPP